MFSVFSACWPTSRVEASGAFQGTDGDCDYVSNDATVRASKRRRSWCRLPEWRGSRDEIFFHFLVATFLAQNGFINVCSFFPKMFWAKKSFSEKKFGKT